MYQTYIVKPGDTLYGISNQYGVSAIELARINNVNATNLQIGQVLNIPTNTGTNPDNLFTYTVKSGDSLYKIANIYKTTVQEIINLNNLKTINLYIGQKLRIPETYTTQEEMVMPKFINYTVKSGDNLYSIAKNNNTTVDEIIRDNGLSTTSLKIGQNLKIRTTIEEIEECFGPDYDVPSSNNYIEYKVKSGDNLYKIANNYSIAMSDIIKLNNLQNTNLSVGQILKIPQTSNKTYTVKKGDSLYSIAKKYNITVNELKAKNNLTNTNLSIGQILNI